MIERDDSPASRLLSYLAADPDAKRELELMVDQMADRKASTIARQREPATFGRLLELYKSLVEARQSFTPGQLVQWKPGLKNRRVPLYGQPVVVVEALAEPVLTDADSGSQYYREPLDIALGIVDQGDDFDVFHFDSRRFEAVKEPGEA